MGIAVLMFTVVVRTEIVNNHYPGGLYAYIKSPYVWHDDFLAGSSFMNGLDVETHINHLGRYFECFDSDYFSRNIAVVDQARGILTKCDWLEFKKDTDGWSICWLRGREPGKIIMPIEGIQED